MELHHYFFQFPNPIVPPAKGRSEGREPFMPDTGTWSSNPPLNQLLARLPHEEFQRLLPQMQRVALDFKHILSEARTRIDHVHFVNHGVISAITIMEDGRGIEVATVGNEGMVGLPLFVGSHTSTNRLLVQVPGEAFRLAADVFRAEVSRDGMLRRILILYHNAYLLQVSQSVGCNGLHSIHQRCCRWLLNTMDRVHEATFPMTHEFLAHMLGVRRSSVSQVLEPLRRQGLIRYSRGKITILDRNQMEAGSCECYRCVREEFERLFGDLDREVV